MSPPEADGAKKPIFIACHCEALWQSIVHAMGQMWTSAAHDMMNKAASAPEDNQKEGARAWATQGKTSAVLPIAAEALRLLAYKL